MLGSTEKDEDLVLDDNTTNSAGDGINDGKKINSKDTFTY
jgi:hypothetical protein